MAGWLLVTVAALAAGPAVLGRLRHTGGGANQSRREAMDRVSGMLDLLLQSGYDPMLRPGGPGRPTEVSLGIALMSLGPLDDARQAITFTCYLR
jgi:hypothetical protein